LFLVGVVIDESNDEACLVDDLELRPVVIEVFGEEAYFLCAVCALVQHFGVGVGLQSQVSVIHFQREDFMIEETVGFLQGFLGEGSEVLEEDGDAEVVVEAFAVSGHE
jgi:hypothetical protein